MPDSWRVVANPASGETFTFIETAEETGGLRVVTLIDLAPGGGVSPHSHRAEEHFECTAGEVSMVLAGQERTISTGEEVTVQPDGMHGLRNRGDVPASVRVTIAPPGDFERTMRALAGLARDGRMVPGHPPRVNPFAMAYLASGDGYYMPPLPRWLYRPLVGALGAIGRKPGERILAQYDAKP